MSESSAKTTAAVIAPSSFDDACAAALASAPKATHERVDLASSIGRVLGQDVAAQEPFPRFDASAMDGWAVATGDGGTRFEVVGESRAGSVHNGELKPGQAVAISTGAVIPTGADAVVPLEEGRQNGAGLVCEQQPQPGAFLRPGGRHAAAGQVVLGSGTRIGAAQIAVLAALGVDRPIVARMPKVMLLAGGDELIAAGDPLREGAVRDSNSPMLLAQLDAAGARAELRSYRSDKAGAVRELLEDAIERSSLVITTGGVSVGRHDHVGSALAAVGAEDVVVGTEARPGVRFRLAVATDDSGNEVPIFCLPGNPLSSFTCFNFYVRRALRGTLGMAEPSREDALLESPLRRHPQRTRLVLGRTERVDDRSWFRPIEVDSDATTALAYADAHAILTPGTGDEARATKIECEKIDG